MDIPNRLHEPLILAEDPSASSIVHGGAVFLPTGTRAGVGDGRVSSWKPIAVDPFQVGTSAENRSAFTTNNISMENEDPVRGITDNEVNESYDMLSRFQWFLLSVTVFHYVMERVLVHLQFFSHHPFMMGRYRHFMFVSDIIRLFFCVFMELYLEILQRGQNIHFYDSFVLNFYHNFRDACKPAVMVLLHAIQTSFLHGALASLPVFLGAGLGFYGVLIGIAACSTLFLRYRYSFQQWVAMFIAVVGACLGGHPSRFHNSPHTLHFFSGMVNLAVAIVAGSLAMVYLERILKQDLALIRAEPPPASFWMRGIQLSLYSAIVNALMWIFHGKIHDSTRSHDGQSSKHDFSFWAWFFTPLQALGLLLTMATLKYVTAVHEKVAFVLADAISLLINTWFLGYQQTSIVALYASVCIMLASVWFFGRDLPQSCWPSQRPPQLFFSSTATSYEPVVTDIS